MHRFSSKGQQETLIIWTKITPEKLNWDYLTPEKRSQKQNLPTESIFQKWQIMLINSRIPDGIDVTVNEFLLNM